MANTFDVKNPANGEIVQTITRNSSEEINQALENGERAFHTWKKTNTHERSRLLKKWSQLIQNEKEAIAKVMTEENGKPLKESRGEVDYATSYIDWFAEEAKRIYGRTIPSHAEGKRLAVRKQPVGLVAAITPWNFPAAMMTRKAAPALLAAGPRWNFPAAMMTRKAAPALAAGCTFVVKPAEATPLTTIRFIELAHEAGFPHHVVQSLNGRRSVVGDLFTSSPLVQKITFTGSTAVGKSLIKDSADTVKAVTMELGGHAPIVVAEDADIDLAVDQTIANKFRNSGQTCICANRVFVHDSVYEAY